MRVYMFVFLHIYEGFTSCQPQYKDFIYIFLIFTKPYELKHI